METHDMINICRVRGEIKRGREYCSDVTGNVIGGK